MTFEFPDKIKSLPKEMEEFTCYNLKAENCDIYFSEISANTHIKPHTHDVDTINLVSYGEFFVTLDGSETSYKPGEWVVIPKNIEHSVRVEVDTKLVEFWFKY